MIPRTKSLEYYHEIPVACLLYIKLGKASRQIRDVSYMMVRRSRLATLLVVLFALSAISAASLAAPMDGQEHINGVDDEMPEAWPEGSAAYDNMVSMTQFGYRKIDTTENENARNWIAEELEGCLLYTSDAADE